MNVSIWSHSNVSEKIVKNHHNLRLSIKTQWAFFFAKLPPVLVGTMTKKYGLTG
jgi:hypothetical protein